MTLVARFNKKVDWSSGPCWNWTGSQDGCGYGHIKVKGTVLRAHRVSWELHRGPLPREAQVLHHCDNPRCVRPGHLFLGDPGDNARDRQKKGRGRSKLTIEQAREIRTRAGREFQRDTARAFGVSQSVVCEIQTGRAWKGIA